MRHLNHIMYVKNLEESKYKNQHWMFKEVAYNLNQGCRIESESNILLRLRNVEKKAILFTQDKLLCERPDLMKVFSDVYDAHISEWKDTSGKADKTPDFYSDTLGTMLEIMRVDDHTFENPDGKIINHTTAKTFQIFNELKKSSLFEKFSDVPIMIIGNTGLPTKEDHRYDKYLANFRRVLESHTSKIPQYRKNHPECKNLVFLIFDESSGYFESDIAYDEHCCGLTYRGCPHFWFFDDDFLEAFDNSEIECIIWFTPYKYAECIPFGFKLPEASIFFNKLRFLNRQKYHKERMIPAEL